MVDDNLAVLRFLEHNPDGPYHGDDLEVLQRWHGWGAAPQVFDRPEWAETRSELERLLGPAGMAAAARTTLNAHYTDPRLVEALWSTVRGLGVDGGVVLEPGCGAGGILAAAGPTWRGIGVELDPTTAKVAAARLDDRHEIVTGDFGRFPLVEGQASAVVGNVPFGQFAVFDPVYNPDLALSIHDHFLSKAAAALAPGGVAAVITSRYTLDSLSPAGRQAIGERADFIGALRLPGVAHEAYAGTRVVTDIVVLRGRPPGQAAQHAPGFLDSPERLDGAAGEVRMSAYYRHHPEHVLGEVGSRSGQYGLELAVSADRASWADGLDAGVRRVVRAAPAAAPPPLVSDPLTLRGPDPGGDRQPVGRIERTETGVFRRCGVDGWEPHAPGSAAGELTALLQLRDGAVALVDAEGDRQVPDALVEERRTALAAAYDAYVQRYGPINRVTITESGQRRAPKMGGFRDDPGWPRVSALELYDESAGKAARAGILRHRVLEPAEPLVRADSPAEALAVSLQRRGRLDEILVAQLLAVDVDEVAGHLGDLAYRDPASDRLVPATEYLSGNVRSKLATARAVADTDPATWGRNVEALERVLPRDVTADELGGLLGAPWIARETVAAFACQLANLPEESPLVSVQRSAELGKWAVKAPTHVTNRLRGDHPYGTEHRDALKLIEDGLNGVNPVVWMTVDGDKRVVNAEATETARERLGEIKEHFDGWLLHDDPDRSQQALAIYNERFNSYVARDYTGMRIDSPGLRSTFRLRDHQHTAVARMLHGGNTLLAHPVGAGKTAEMIVGAMELKRVGTVNRPCFVVPNHMLEQFGRDIIDLYPAAEVLVISKDDVSPLGRAAFAARARSHDWDAVIITHSSMSRWPLSAEVTARNLETRIDRYRRDLSTIEGQGDNRTLTKVVEKRLARHQERLLASRARIEGRQDDHDLPFDRAGIDYVLVDEAHTYKNAEVQSSVRNLRGVPVGDGSQIAEDMGDKLAWLRQAHPDRPIATFATGTPISNTVAEMWVLGRYLRPDLLDELGIQSFDAFRAQFCQTTSTMELDPSGTQFRQVERLARYQALPELARWWGEFADVVQIEDLGLPRPALDTGSRQVITVEPPAGLALYMSEVVSARADAIRQRRVQPSEDNMLKLSSDCRAASFDWATFAGQDVDEANSALAACADRVAATYHEHRNRTYRTAAGHEHPRRGAFQLVFADLGTPKPGRDDTTYDNLKALLVRRGIPAEAVQFAHDHDANDAAKGRFFAACRDGRVAVAISSTAKMGVGTNVQDRLAALHHLDCPWRPSDIEQREGRIMRQGNQHPTVAIYAYATERSFSVYGWQTLERKAGFIGQVMRATPDGPRSVEVSDTEALSYGEVKALATGDPDFLQAAKLDDQVARLERLARAHGRDTVAAQRRVAAGEREAPLLDRQIADLAPIAARIGGLDPDRRWQVTIGDAVIDNRADAARALVDATTWQRSPTTVAHLPAEGLQIRFRPEPTTRGATYELAGTDGARFGGYGQALVEDRFAISEVVGALTRLDNRARALPGHLAELQQRRAGLDDRIAAARETAERPFPHRQELQEARTAVEKVRARLTERYSEVEEMPTEVPPTAEAAPARNPAGPAVAQPANPLARSAAGRIAQPPPDVRRPEPPGRPFGR